MAKETYNFTEPTNRSHPIYTAFVADAAVTQNDYPPQMHEQCNTLQHTTTHCNALQRTATHCNSLERTATHCRYLQWWRRSICNFHTVRTTTHCNALQLTATHCNSLQRTTTHCRYLQWWRRSICHHHRENIISGRRTPAHLRLIA